ncbi:type I polyketide synthase [Streptacidiphilus sp. 4-A2]|nr:type I polyketide synthase [Streptacidiphilus sp. 4-A2]
MGAGQPDDPRRPLPSLRPGRERHHLRQRRRRGGAQAAQRRARRRRLHPGRRARNRGEQRRVRQGRLQRPQRHRSVRGDRRGTGEAGVHPAQMSYVEAHATGTPLGDPIEVTALTQAYQQLAHGELAPGSCSIGSVKGNVGHLGHASGVTALIKVVLSLENEQLPPSINCDEPNPKLGLESSPFRVNTELTPWPRTAGRPRLAGVSSLGIGGTNVHAIVEEGPSPALTAPDGRERVLVWSGKTPQAERDYRDRLAQHLARAGGAAFADTAATLQRGRTAHLHRAALVAADADAAESALTDARAPKVVLGRGVAAPRGIVFLLPGQGTQHTGMARGLYGTDAAFTRAFDQCLDLFDDHGIAVRTAWHGAEGDELQGTALAQPLLFAVEYALSRMWLSWGVRPSGLLGHSIGELAAAAVAGVFSLTDGAALVAARARAMAQAQTGGMYAVAASAETVAPLLPQGLSLAVDNGPRQTVVAGPLPELDAFAEVLKARGISARPVRTSHAFHSPMMAAAAETFERAFDGVELHAPAIPIHSAATGRLVTDAEAMSPGFWARQLVDPVRLVRRWAPCWRTPICCCSKSVPDGRWRRWPPGTRRWIPHGTRSRPPCRGSARPATAATGAPPWTRSR